MKIAFISLLSFLLLTIGYEIMVAAFHLLNMPSDRAVYEGIAILVVLAVFLPFALIRIWRLL